MANKFVDVIALVNTSAWPVVAVMALLALRSPIERFLQEMRGRIRKVSAFDFSILLTKVTEFTPSWSKPHLLDVR